MAKFRAAAGLGCAPSRIAAGLSPLAQGALSLALAAQLSGCIGEPSPAPDGWRGRSSQDLRALWGEPDVRTPLGNGRQVWCYAHPPATPSYVDDVREARRTVTSADGGQRDEIVHELYPVRRAADGARPSLRLEIADDGRIEATVPDATACAAKREGQRG